MQNQMRQALKRYSIIETKVYPKIVKCKEKTNSKQRVTLGKGSPKHNTVCMGGQRDCGWPSVSSELTMEFERMAGHSNTIL